MWILRILGPIKFCKGPIKISNGPLKFGNLHVFEWDMGHWPILRAHHHCGLGLTLVKSRSLLIKLIPNVISNMLIILALKTRWKSVLNNAETNIFRWDMLFLAVPAGSVSRCFVTYSKNMVILAGTDKCLISLKMNSIHFEGRRSLHTTKKTFDSPDYMPCLC